MKRNILIVFILLFAVATQAQRYTPTTKWPYIYKDFQMGTVYFSDGDTLDLYVNIHLLRSNLHYLRGDMILNSDAANPIDSVKINHAKYIVSNNQFVEVVREVKNNKFFILRKGDFDVLFTSTGAYGTAAHTSSVNDLISYDIGGLSNMNHRQLILEKEDGKVLPLKTTYLFEIDGKEIPASKKAFKKALDPDTNKKFEKFIKDNKIKWNKITDLVKILDFF